MHMMHRFFPNQDSKPAVTIGGVHKNLCVKKDVHCNLLSVVTPYFAE